MYVWEDADDDSDVVTKYRTYEGHREDITHMASCPERQVRGRGLTGASRARLGPDPGLWGQSGD